MILPISQSATFTDLFNKLNEVISSLNTQESEIGDLSLLDSLHSNNLVDAINEKGPSVVLSLILED